ncbi:MAG: hypothetical protein JWQ71_1623 [Pedosphaera sp.]|nr:hypothetical protein [Pedosphaera sp.]
MIESAVIKLKVTTKGNMLSQLALLFDYPSRLSLTPCFSWVPGQTHNQNRFNGFTISNCFYIAAS